MNIVLIGLHTSILKPAEFSEIATYYIYFGIASIVLTYGMETAFFRFYSKSATKNTVISTVSISLLITTFSAFSCVFIFQNFISTELGLSLFRLRILAATLIVETLWVVPFAYYRIKGWAKKFTITKLIGVLLYVTLNFYFLKFVPLYAIKLPKYLVLTAVDYVFVANMLASILTFLIVIPVYFKQKWKFDTAILKQMLRYSWPILVAGIAFMINESIDKLILKDQLGKNVMGAYAACYKLAMFLTLFIQAFRMGVEPFFFNQSESKNARQTYATVMKFYVIFASLGLLFVIVFIDEFKRLMIRDSSYWYAISIVPIVLLANWCLGAYHSLSVWYKVTDRTRYGMWFSVFGALITLTFNYSLIKYYGFMVAAWVTLAAYGSMMLLSYFVGRKKYPIPYDLKSILGYLAIALSISMTVYLNFRTIFWVKAVAVFVFLFTILIFERATILSMFKKRRI